MIGSKYIEIDWRNFVQGMTTTDFTEDGGFSVGSGGTSISTTNINPIVNPGLLSFPSLVTDKSSGLTGDIIASCEDPTNTYSRLFISADADTDGRFWSSVADGTLTQRGSEDTTPVYASGRTDMMPFAGEVYFTNSTQIRQWQLPATFDNSANFPFTFNDTSAFHPSIVYENNAYYGDGNELLRQTGAGTLPAVILTLPTNQTIQAIGVDPASGKMLLSILDQYDHANTENVQARVGYYNGYSSKLDKVVLIPEMMTCFHNLGGTVFTGYGRNFGYWNGTGVQFLRELHNTADSGALLYKHHITSKADIIYIIDQSRILAYGEVMQGQGRSWWYAYQNFPSGVATNLTNIVNFGGANLKKNLAISYGTAKFDILDLNTTASKQGSSAFFSKRYRFPKSVTFNSLVIDYSVAVADSTDIGIATMIDDTGTGLQLETVNTPETNKRTFHLTNPTLESRSLQIKYIPLVNTPIERITLFYTPKE